MAAPLITVVTASLNAASTIGDTMRSVQAQVGLGGQVEHWVIDGGSTDGTLAIVQSYPHARWISERDSGIAEAFNKGLRRATGTWILFLNADDFLIGSSTLRDMSRFLDEQYDIVYGQAEIVDAATGTIREVIGDEHAWKRLGWRMKFWHQAVFFHRRYFERFGEYSTEYAITMDYELLLRGYRRTRYRFAPVLVSRFRTGGASDHRRGILRLVREMLRAKTSNNVGTPAARYCAALYQGARFAVDPFMARIPVAATLYLWATNIVSAVSDAYWNLVHELRLDRRR